MPAVASMKDEPVVFFASAEEWDDWLGDNHQASSGVRIKIAKKGTGIESVAYPMVLDVAISYGWIDGVRNALDESYFLQRFTPRGPRSRWSKINRDKASRLIEGGLMKPAGMREVELARADGRWDAAYDSHRTATVPDDLQRALEAHPNAAEAFAALNGQNRYAVLYRVAEAKRAETRARRIAQFVEMLARGERPYP